MILTLREPSRTGLCLPTRQEAEQFHRHAIECGTFCSYPIEIPFADGWACDWWTPFQSESIHAEALMLDEAWALMREIEAVRS